MANNEDPPHISALLNMSDPFCQHIIVINSTGRKLERERIAVVAQILEAHSPFFRSVWDRQTWQLDSYLEDLTIYGISPCIFKNMLRFLYGHNIIDTVPLLEIMQHLRFSVKMKMKEYKMAAVKAFLHRVSTTNVCIFLSDPICLIIPTTKEHVTSILDQSLIQVLACRELPRICLEGWNFILELDIEPTEVWKALVNWAQCRVYGYEEVPLAQQLKNGKVKLAKIEPELIYPRPINTPNCSKILVNMMEKVLSKETSKEKVTKLKDFILKYHTISRDCSRVYICIETRKEGRTHIVHHEVSVKIIYNLQGSSLPILRKESQLTVCTGDRPVELYSVVCSSILRVEDSCKNYSLHLEPAEFHCDVYVCNCLVKVLLGKQVKYEVKFDETVIYKTEFQISLKSDDNKVILQPNQKYVVKLSFDDVHPMWYTYTNKVKNNDKNKPDLKVDSGEVQDRVNTLLTSASHIKYLLYRNV